MSVMGSAKQPPVDTDVRTGAVVSSSPAVDSAASSDMFTIRNAVTSTDLEQAAVQPLAWANAETGSRGIIEKIQQYEEQNRLCRKFEVLRESYKGVAMFDGDACVANNGEWMVRRFEQR
ncbi:hypothetical protein GCM10010136_18600 [Limoniibacter endophyticus]|uniref:Surface antigen domain-containing protein n=2 Tax=Limoniibacter endophyticus TaxID=1565040 RepID=A0A8J3GIC6_9HYPH|nr:hypothetical protein GCM10010136_18600 [Limoniibacter endophyticus]